MGAFSLASSASAAGFGAGTAPGTDKATARAAAGTSHTGQSIEGEMDFSPVLGFRGKPTPVPTNGRGPQKTRKLMTGFLPIR